MTTIAISRDTDRDDSHFAARDTASASQRESAADQRFSHSRDSRDSRDSRVRTADEVPPWFVWASLVLVAGPSFAALAWFQHELFAAAWTSESGVSAPWPITLGLAVAVDSFGAMAGVYWFRSKRNATLRAWGRFFAIAAVLGTTALMCTAIHRLFPGWEVLGVIPAVIVFGTTKLVTMWQTDRAGHRDELGEADARAADAEAERDELARLLADEREQRAILVAQPAPAVEPPTVPIPVPERTRPAPGAKVAAIGGSKTERGRAFVLEHIAEHGKPPTGAEVDAHVGGSSTGRAVLRKMRESGELDDAERAASA